MVPLRCRVVLLFAVLFAVLFAAACGASLPGGSSPSSELPGEVGDPEPGFATGVASGPEPPFRAEVYTSPGELPSLKVATDDNKPLPLQHTAVKATLSGFTADVEVAQTYSNPYKTPIEAIYVFPLPESSAVYSMKMVIGPRVIEAVVKERAAARAIYEKAKREGHTAALLEQERPNVFTQSVANIAPGQKIEVILRYVQDLSYDAGEYEMVFPMVVGPRYIPGEPLDQPPSGTGTYADTARVPDASRVTPPVLGKGQRSGHDISLEVVASAEGVVSSFSVPTHDVVTEKRADGSLRVVLSDEDSIPNRDFVLRYRVAGDRPRAVLYASGTTAGHFSLILQPPRLDVDALVGKRELVFVVDVSGSMTGQPLALCKAAMRHALQRLRPVDTFNVITFAGASAKLFPAPRPASEEAIRDALEHIDALTAGGGTELRNAVEMALSPDVEPGRGRYVFFLTDGFVGNEPDILDRTRAFVAALEKKGQRARVFGFGTGGSVNRMLLDGLGKQGRGLAVYASLREDPARAVNKFYRYIDRSVLREVRVDFGALGAKDVEPAVLPDLFASHPLILHGRYAGSLAGPVVVHATSASGPVDIPVTIARAPATDGWPVQALLWARARIGTLEQDLWSGSTEAEEAITKLGVEHHLVTHFTSFVAVDNNTAVGDGRPTTVVQPVQVPEGVDGTQAGAREQAPTAQEDYGYGFDEDPLTAGGFGPNDAVIRVRPGPSGGSSPPPSATSGALHAEMYAAQQVRPGLRGCNCDVAGSSPGSPRGPLSLALLAAALFLRRAGQARSRDHVPRPGPIHREAPPDPQVIRIASRRNFTAGE